MAKGKQSSNYDAVGGIFDFIFQEADKPVDKRRPVRPTGFSAGEALTDQMFAVLEKPGAFVSNTIINEFNSALDVNIAQANFNEYGSIKLSTNNLANYIKDPAGEVKKIADRAKAARKASRARMLGEAMDDFLTTAWAHKYGDLEAKKISLASATANKKNESYKIAKALGQSRRPTETTSGPGLPNKSVSNADSSNDFMINRTVELMGKTTFGSGWESLPDADKDKFTAFLMRGKISTVETQSFLVRNFGTGPARNFGMVLLSFKDDEKVSLSDPEVYKTIENDHITGRINALRGAAPNSPEEKQRKIYEKTKVMINLRTKKQIGELTEKLTDPTLTPTQRARIDQAILDGETALRLVGGRTFLVSSIGKWEGYINSINTVWGGVMGAQSLVPSILDGKFFDSKKNAIGPTTGVGNLGIKGLENLELIVAREGNNKVINAYNQMGEALYYMTPRSIFKTFFVNGEGFARLLYRNGLGLKNLEDSLGSFGVPGLKADIITQGINQFVGRDLDNYINTTLSSISASGSLTPQDLEKITKLLNSSKNMRNLTHFFSLPARMNKVISKRIGDFIGPKMKKIRAKIVRVFLKNKNIARWISKTGGWGLLKEFVKNGGLKNLLKPIFTAVAGALGIALTPLVGFVISLAMGVVMNLAIKGAKLLLQIGQIMLIAVVAAVVLGFGGAKKVWKKFNKKSYSYNYVVPNTVNYCDKYGVLYPGGITDPGTPLDPSYDTPCAGGSFTTSDLFEQAKTMVSEKYGDVSGSGLALYDCDGGDSQTAECIAIGDYTCYAFNPIACKSSLAGMSCDYQFNIFVHELMHHVQNGGCRDWVFREWGADYNSNNGGWYSFNIGGSCIRATETPIPAACSSESMVSRIASCNAGPGDEACRDALNQIVPSSPC